MEEEKKEVTKMGQIGRGNERKLITMKGTRRKDTEFQKGKRSVKVRRESGKRKEGKR